jgi:lysophospholipase L1-like esterase
MTAAIWLPIGTSITNGAHDGQSTPTPMGGFRGHEYNALNANGYPVICMGRLIGPYPFGGHEGHNGWTTSAALADLDAIMAVCPRPSIVTVEFGINDVKDGPDDAYRATIADRIGELCLRVLRQAPEAWLLPFAAIPTTNDGIPNAQHWLDILNAALPAVVAGVRATSGSTRVVLVDVCERFNAAVDLSDTVHPNDHGFQMMSIPLYATMTKIIAGQLTGAPAAFAGSDVPPAELAATIALTVGGATYRGEGLVLGRVSP